MWRVEWCGVDLAPGIRYCWGVLLRSFRRHYGVVVQARVEDYPRDQESGDFLVDNNSLKRYSNALA